jgi:hypothetical protein
MDLIVDLDAQRRQNLLHLPEIEPILLDVQVPTLYRLSYPGSTILE